MTTRVGGIDSGDSVTLRPVPELREVVLEACEVVPGAPGPFLSEVRLPPTDARVLANALVEIARALEAEEEPDAAL